MFRSTNKATMLLLLFTGAFAVPGWMAPNSRGPGQGEDGAGETGEPHKGYHVRTLDSTKKWNEMIKLTNNTQKQNQHIVADADKDETNPLRIDPANGIFGEGIWVEKYKFWETAENYYLNAKTALWDVPVGANPRINPDGKSQGYPSNLPKYEDWDFVSTMRQMGYLDSEDGVLLKSNDDKRVGYNTLSDGKDYMLLYFGWEECPDCKEFTKRFSKYYNDELDHQKVGVVYFGHEKTELQFDDYRKTMPFPAARFDKNHELIFRLKNVLKKDMSVPCVVVIDKEGNVVTTQGVQGIRGDEDRDGKYPLPSAPHLFESQAILPGNQHCSIDTDEQRRELIQIADAVFREMNEEHLRAALARLHVKNPTLSIPADILSGTSSVEALRNFLEKVSRDGVNNSDDKSIEGAYIANELRENEPSNYHFQVGDFVRVKQSYTSDPETLGGSTNDVPVESIGGGSKHNVGKIVYVTPATATGDADSAEAGVVAGSIKVEFKHNTYLRCWLLPKRFGLIEKITKDEAFREGFPRDA